MGGQPKVDWLVDGVLPREARAMLYADSGVGKSFVALDMALHIACGIKWQGRAVKQGAVYYVAAENPSTFYRRSQAWETLHKGGRRWAKKHDGEHPPFYLRKAPVNLYTATEVDAHLSQLGPSQLVIYDTLSRSMDGGDPLDNAHANFVLSQADRIIAQTGATVLLVHHTPAVGRNPMGARSWVNGSQAVWEVTRRHEGAEKTFSTGPGFREGDKIVLTCKKLTDADTPKEIALPVRLMTLQKGLTVPAIASEEVASRRSSEKGAGVGPTGKRRTAGSQRVPFPQVYAECDGDKAEIMRRTGKNEAAYRQAVSRMNRPKQPDTDGNAA